MQDISDHEDFFKSFFESFLAREREDAAPLRLKYEHSLNVLAHARRLARTGALRLAGHDPALLEHAALLAALYHDLARFPQFFHWRTFSDKRSVDHGRHAVRLLKEERALASESPALRRLVLGAVILHNRYALPPDLPEDVRLIADAVRDADKLDICRVFAEQLGDGGERSAVALLNVKDDPALYNPEVIEDALTRRVAAYADLRSVNDFRVLLGTWQYDLRFEESRAALAEAGHLRRLLENLPPLEALRPAREQLLADLRRP